MWCWAVIAGKDSLLQFYNIVRCPRAERRALHNAIWVDLAYFSACLLAYQISSGQAGELLTSLCTSHTTEYPGLLHPSSLSMLLRLASIWFPCHEYHINTSSLCDVRPHSFHCNFKYLVSSVSFLCPNYSILFLFAALQSMNVWKKVP